MKKFFLIPLLIYLILASSGCGDSGKSDSESGEYDDSVCKYDTYQCFYDRSWYGDSYYCGFSNNNKLGWHLSELCEAGCNETTGKCSAGGSSGAGSGYDDSSDNNSGGGSNNNSNDSGSETRTVNCTGLPANAEWNTASSITQTKDGSSWTPSAAGTYNTTPSTKECRYKCVDGYAWNGSKCFDPCEPNPCSDIESSTEDCIVVESGYKCGCVEGFIWNGTECADPCTPNPCRDKKNSSGACNVASDGKYFCECKETFTWNGSECLNPCDPNPCDTIENATGDCKKIDDFTKYSCECEKKYVWYEGECRRDLCNPNPCLEVYNATGKCTNAADYSEYYCECDETFTWNGSVCKTFPQCSPSSETPCKDSLSGLIWSAKSPDTMDWQSAVAYCEDSTEDGFKDWRLPTINELRTLIRYCSETMLGGSCAVRDPDCLEVYCCDTNKCRCEFDWDIYDAGGYSRFGENVTLWSSSVVSDYSVAVWTLSFSDALLIFNRKSESDYVRCVR